MKDSNKRYSNLDNINSLRTAKDILKWWKERRSKIKDLSYKIPQENHVDLHFLQNNRDQCSITWIGHATFLIQMGGLNILTDPVWAKRMGFQKRLSEPGIPLNEIPEIDVVLISHGHYDHLDFPSIRRIKGAPIFFIPAGLSKVMILNGIDKIEELNWWDDKQIGNVNFSFVPAQHWVRRTLWDTNASHWGGWMIEMEGEKTIYFAGDSGYFRGFKEIGERFTIDYALLPIGAYEPEWFMSAQHVTPEESIKAFIDLKAKKFIPMHYGAFRLADDTPKEGLDRLLAEWNRLRLPEEQLVIVKLGEVLRGIEHEN